jgi:hypothetical protein
VNNSKLFLSALIFGGLAVLPAGAVCAGLLAQTTNVKTEAVPLNTSVSAPSAAVSPNTAKTAKTAVPTNAATVLVPQTTASAAKKCGVNTFSVTNECGVGTFKNMYVQCYDGYEEKQGGESSCKSSETWQEYAKSVCANRCGTVTQPIPSTSSGQPGVSAVTRVPAATPTAVSQPVPLAPPIAICEISDASSKEYDVLISELQKAESSGDKAAADEITRKITALKQEIARERQNCQTTVVPQTGTQAISASAAAPTAVSAGTIDRCAEVKQWENKITYYEKLAESDESVLKNEYGLFADDVKKILSDLETGLEKVKTQCAGQNSLSASGGGEAVALPQAIAEPVMPVAIQSAGEINDYYKEKIQAITSAETSA